MKSELDKHDIIAWDMDGTLIDGRNSNSFRQYIVNNPDKKHYIITFRDPNWASRIFNELEACGMDDPSVYIDGIYSCPVDWHYYNDVNHNPRMARVKTQYLETNKITQETLDMYSRLFRQFKGSMAAELGCTVMVDDIDQWVEQGCIDNGVCFLHALDRYE